MEIIIKKNNEEIQQLKTKEIFKKALHSGFNGYKAMTFQVTTLMWLRTIMNYQYKYGTSLKETVNILYSKGGIRRFYSGMIPALIQGPVSRFGDTFSNTFILNLTKKSNLPIYLKTALASTTAGIVRILMTPMDTVKTMSQVEGKEALNILRNKINNNGIISLYHGAFANGIVTLIGHYPWFLTHNYLNKFFPAKEDDTQLKKLSRNALIGFCSSLVSDTTSNFMRVIKTYRQTNATQISYYNCVKAIVNKDGVSGLLFRGLGIRLITNGIQGLMFNVMWKYLDSKNKNIKSLSNDTIQDDKKKKKINCGIFSGASSFFFFNKISGNENKEKNQNK